MLTELDSNKSPFENIYNNDIFQKRKYGNLIIFNKSTH